jgi:5-methylcytosine-specific restriction endonuclease McrA
MTGKECRLCGRVKPAESFLAGKAKRVSTTCATCRSKLAAKHRRNYYASLPADKRHTLSARKRAADAGVVSVPYSRTAILARWRYLCAYCDARAEHLDHVHPISKGGPDAEENMVPACAQCNLTKGAKTLAEWVESWR